jgi:histidinol phosphatase-like enzyme
VTAAAPFDRRFGLLDRDETIIIDKIYLSDPKPAPGLVLDAMADFGFAREDVALIGDGEADMAAAAARGVKGVRVAPNFLMAARQAIDYFRGRQTKRRPCM